MIEAYLDVFFAAGFFVAGLVGDFLVADGFAADFLTTFFFSTIGSIDSASSSELEAGVSKTGSTTADTISGSADPGRCLQTNTASAHTATTAIRV